MLYNEVKMHKYLLAILIFLFISMEIKSQSIYDTKSSSKIEKGWSSSEAILYGPHKILNSSFDQNLKHNFTIGKFMWSFGKSFPFQRFGGGLSCFDYLDGGDPNKSVLSFPQIYLCYIPFMLTDYQDLQPAEYIEEKKDETIIHYDPNKTVIGIRAKAMLQLYISGSLWALDPAQPDEEESKYGWTSSSQQSKNKSDQSVWGKTKFIKVGVEAILYFSLAEKVKYWYQLNSISLDVGAISIYRNGKNISFPYIGLRLGVAHGLFFY
jgi:hypothetical protein